MRYLALLILLSIFSCSFLKEGKTAGLQYEIDSVYYQKWIAGIQGGGSGIHFHVNFKKPLEGEVILEKVQFITYEAFFVKSSDTSYVAFIKTNLNQKDFILDENPEKEYGNEAPKSNSLKPDEALLYFYIPSRNKYVVRLAENVKEKPMLAYPSRKPQNITN